MSEAAKFEWIGVREYAIARGVTTRTVRRWIQRQYVEAERHGPRGKWLIKVTKAA